MVGRDGTFTLAGVPPGTVTLVFSNNGVSAGILLTNVGLNQLIVLDVRVNGGVATIESERRRRRDQTRVRPTVGCHAYCLRNDCTPQVNAGGVLCS